MSFRRQLMRSTRIILEFMERSNLIINLEQLIQSTNHRWLLWWKFALIEFHSIFAFHHGAGSVLSKEIQVHTDCRATCMWETIWFLPLFYGSLSLHIFSASNAGTTFSLGYNRGRGWSRTTHGVLCVGNLRKQTAWHQRIPTIWPFSHRFLVEITVDCNLNTEIFVVAIDGLEIFWSFS